MEHPAEAMPTPAVSAATNILVDGVRRSVKRYSVSFQDKYVTEVTPLLGSRQRSQSKPRSTSRNLCAAHARSASANDNYDEDLSECESSVNRHDHCRPSSSWAGHRSSCANVNYESDDQDQASGNRSYSDGPAILQYTSQGDGPARPMSLCTHGQIYDSCCGKKDTDTIPNGHSPDVDVREGKEVGHCHSSAQREVDKAARRRLLIASVLCLVFMVGEIIGGYLADSLAIMTDAAHLLTDFASFMISLFALFVATRPPTKRMSFGWYRAEVIGALTSVIMIWVVTGILVYLAVERIMYKKYDINAVIMLITSGVGVGVNIIMGLTLHSHGHSHGGQASHGHSHSEKKIAEEHSHNNGDGSEEHNNGHGHSHSADHRDDHRHAEEGSASEQSTLKKQENINVRAAYIHVIGDFIQSVGVFIAAIVIYLKPEWQIVDPICTFLFSILVLLTTFAIMKDTLTVLMEGLPKGVDFNDVHKTFLSIQGVVQVHNLRIWSLSMDKVALSAHVVINPGINPRDILNQASRIVRDKYSFFEMTLQIEDLKEDMATCEECLGPAQ